MTSFRIGIDNKIGIALFLAVALVSCTAPGSGSTDPRLLGKWRIVSVDNSAGSAGGAAAYLSDLLGTDEDSADVSGISEMLPGLSGAFGVEMTFTRNRMRFEVLRTRATYRYKTNGNTIVLVDEDGLEIASVFLFDGQKLIYSGFVWDKTR